MLFLSKTSLLKQSIIFLVIHVNIIKMGYAVKTVRSVWARHHLANYLSVLDINISKIALLSNDLKFKLSHIAKDGFVDISATINSPRKTEGSEEALFWIWGGYVHISATLIYEGGFVDISAILILQSGFHISYKWLIKETSF
jgi:hypothetical protein